jgi:hypothetical protein
MPEPPKAKPADSSSGKQSGAPETPPAPSTRMTNLEVAGVQLRHPDNWRPSVEGNHVTIAPNGGLVGQGLAYGLITDVFKSQNARNLDQATTQFLNSLRQGNPAMKIVRSRVRAQVDGLVAQLTEVTNESPIGGQETDVIITLLVARDELRYFVWVAPTSAFKQYEPAFRAIMNSVKIR